MKKNIGNCITFNIGSFNDVRVNVLYTRLNNGTSHVLATAFNSDNISLGVLHRIEIECNDSLSFTYIAALKKLYKINGKLPRKFFPSYSCFRYLETELANSVDTQIDENNFDSKRKYLDYLIIERFNKYKF